MLADLALMNGKVLTMNPKQPYAEAIAIKNDTIVKVGTNEEINRWIGKNTKIIRLKERTVVPGFIDTHIHVGDFGRFLTWVDLRGVKSIEQMQRRIRRRAHKTPRGKWIIGHGWDHNHFMEKRFPNLSELDEASPNKPVVLYHQFGRICVVNSKALELACVTKQTSAPSGGKIGKNAETGELTGVLQDNATDLVWKMIPEPTEEEIKKAAGLACEKIVEAGVTSVHWIVSSTMEISIIQRLLLENKLPLRIYIIIPVNLLGDLTDLTSFKDFGDDKVRIGGIEIFADGFLAARTAALKEPYSDNPASKGRLVCTPEEIERLVVEVYKARLQPLIHAMGDEAIHLALTVIKKISIEAPRKDQRHRIDQASVLNQELIRRIKKQKVMVSVQPKCIISEFTIWSATNHLGPERVRWLYPLKTLFKEGVIVCGGSDCPMEPLSPLSGIQAAVTRKFIPEERISVDEALRMYTVNAAYSSLEENVKGSIEEGKLADLTVVSRDPLEVPPNKIEEIKVEMTIVGGRVAYTKMLS